MAQRAPRRRPKMEALRTAEEFRRWYWLKTELVEYCRAQGLATAGNKPDLQARIETWLTDGTRQAPAARPKRQGIDWRQATLTPATRIDGAYRNTQNMRAFMKHHASPRFAFSNEFMQWMRSNVGKTLADAVAFWTELDRKKREDGYREASLPQNQYAQFSRAIAEAAPGIKAINIRRIWKLKRTGPGPHVYTPGDENL
ncbi:MAG: DUF6434 domain-containing protein [Myxococcota bacterium]